jgi:hypothetical protein
MWNSKMEVPGKRVLLCCFAIATLLWLRRPDSIMNAQFWAEDGFILFHDRVVYGAAGSLHHVYAGYYTVLPRLIAAGASVLPVALVPLAYSVSALIISTVCLASFSLPQCRSILSSDSMRVVASLLFATAVYSSEIVGVLINTQWFLLIPATLGLFSGAKPTSRYQKALNFFLGALLGLTAPLLIVLVPICVWRILKSRSVRFPYDLGLLVALGVQSIAFTANARSMGTHSGAIPTIGAAAASAVYGIVLRTMLGHATALGLAIVRNVTAVTAVAAAGSAWLTWFWMSSQREERIRLLLGLYLAAASLALAIAGRGLAGPFGTLAGFRGWGSERYFFFPSCIFIYLVALSVEKAAVRIRPALSGILLVTLFLGGIVQNYRIDSFVDFHWRSYTGGLEAVIRELSAGRTAAISVPINPAPWKISIP